MTKPLSVRLPAHEVAEWHRRAAAQGTTVSELLRGGGFGPLTLEAEPPPYTIDWRGQLRPGPQGFDFSTDLIRALRDNDRDAKRRAEGFVRMAFDVTVANVAGVNPNVQRGDLYVGQNNFPYPIWNGINKGTLDNGTPFIIPKFSSATGLVSAHVEGTEPGASTFVATPQTVTPAPLSGKVSISREAWDQGGNPMASDIIWRQVQQAWLEALEAAAFTHLESLAPTTFTVTALAVDVALQDSLLSQLATLDYVRGGWRMRDLVLQIDLYGRLAAAKDTAGNKLFPMLMGRDGVDDTFGAIPVAGRVGRPAWALAGTGVVPQNSYLFDRGVVNGWASPPQRLELDEVEVRYVHLGIWGFKAFATTDVSGVRRITYDPA